MKYKRGISLMVLIITIVVIIILATAVILTLNKNNPILSSKEARFENDVSVFQDELSLYILKEYTISQGKLTNKINADKYLKEGSQGFGDDSIYKYIPSFKEEYNDKFLIIDDELIATTKLTQEEQNIIKEKGMKIIEIKRIDELLNDSKDELDKYIGDFVNYDAGVWSEEEIKSITARNSVTDYPNKTFQFYGFAIGSSRNESAVNKGIDTSGWRIFDISKDGITLISAGTPERYYQWGNNNYAYYSEYILTGNVNEKATSLNIESKFTKRNYSMYVNSKASYAGVLTKTILDSWYGKYFNIDNADVIDLNISSKVLKTKKENLIALDSFLVTPTNNSLGIYAYRMNQRSAGIGTALIGGNIRVIIKLNKDVGLINTNQTKNIGNYSYNVWNIK